MAKTQMNWRLAQTLAILASLAVENPLAGQTAPPISTVALSTADSKSAPVPAGSIATLLSFTADPSSFGGDQLDVVTSDPNVVISPQCVVRGLTALVMERGVTFMAESYIIMGLLFHSAKKLDVDPLPVV